MKKYSYVENFHICHDVKYLATEEECADKQGIADGLAMPPDLNYMHCILKIMVYM